MVFIASVWMSCVKQFTGDRLKGARRSLEFLMQYIFQFFLEMWVV